MAEVCRTAGTPPGANRLRGDGRRWCPLSKRLFPILILLLLAGGLLFAQEPRRLSMDEAIRLALSEGGNLQAAIADLSTEVSRARSDQARALLLPHLNGGLSQRRQTSNLQAVGLSEIGPFQPPRLLGPFSTFDARAEFSQSIFNWSSIQRFRSSRIAAESAEIQAERTRDEIAAAVAQFYLAALRDQARVESARANRDLASELVELARSQKAAGTGLAIEVTRAEVKLSREEQAVLVAEQSLKASLLQLNRVIGLPLAERIELTEAMERPEGDTPGAEEARLRALESRADLAAQVRKVDALEKDYSAARAERLPSLAGFADYGTVGTAPSDSIPTWKVGVRVDLPVFDGGGMEARRAESRLRLEQERLKVEDLRREIGLEVELALTAMEIAQGEVTAVESALSQARLEMEQAQRRYRAGVTTSLEVTEAQTSLKDAEDARIGALYRFNLARIQFEDATGALRSSNRP